ncbi:MAG: Hsp20/alpha crystallin family protein [Ginsengibacter sp.]
MTVLKLNHPINRSFNGWVEDILNELPSSSGTSRENALLPMVNISENKDSYNLVMAAPGRNKEDFRINLEKNILTISSDITPQGNDDEKQIRKEFNFQPFKRSFTVDDKIASDKIGASYENGLLKLHLPKNEEMKPSVKQIVIS